MSIFSVFIARPNNRLQIQHHTIYFDIAKFLLYYTINATSRCSLAFDHSSHGYRLTDRHILKEINLHLAIKIGRTEQQKSLSLARHCKP